MSRRVVLALVLAAVAIAGAGCAGSTAPARMSATTSSASRGHRRGARASAVKRPNIVFVLTDDLSRDLTRFIPQVARMRREGMSFGNYYVTDSLCCPSRASIFTGDFPHDTGVRSNAPPTGGFPSYMEHGDENRTFATALRRRGYDTALMGKFLNGYLPSEGEPGPGWSHWALAGNGYPEFGYTLDLDGRLRHYGFRPRDYLTDVLARRGAHFIRRAHAHHRPFMLELATFAPHRPSTPAPRYRHRFPRLRAPRGPAYDRRNRHAPHWLDHRRSLSRAMRAHLDREYRLRARSVVAVNDLIRRERRVLRRHGMARDTYFVFSSDNGYHMGQHRLDAGKMTAFDSDIHVPLLVVGPGVAPGTQSTALTENVDLAPTFDQLAGARRAPGIDGRSLVPLLHGRVPRNWRSAVLVEHTHPAPSPRDPDEQTSGAGDPPSYDALRTRTGTYVEYRRGGREYYDHTTDPNELDNVIGELTRYRRRILHRTLHRLVDCHGSAACRRAARLPSGFG